MFIVPEQQRHFPLPLVLFRQGLMCLRLALMAAVCSPSRSGPRQFTRYFLLFACLHSAIGWGLVLLSGVMVVSFAVAAETVSPEIARVQGLQAFQRGAFDEAAVQWEAAAKGFADEEKLQ